MTDDTAGALAAALRTIIRLSLHDPAAREVAEAAVVDFLKSVESDSYAEWERRMGDDL